MPRTPKRLGRPPLNIDGSKVEQLAAIGLTETEISGVLGCSVDTLQRRYSAQVKVGWERMKASIKRAQYDVGVVKKNPTMLIWLGKQHCGQSDNAGERTKAGSTSQLDALYEALMAGPVKKAATVGGGENDGSAGNGGEGEGQAG